MSLIAQISAVVTQIGAKLKALEATPIHTAQTAAYTFVAGDIGACTPLNSSTAANFTIPAGLTSRIGDVLYIAQDGSAAVTFVAGSGVIINPTGNATTHQGDWCCAIFRRNDVNNDYWDAL